MKLWIDAQLSPAIAKWINTHFSELEAVAVRDLGYATAEDVIIFFAAREAEATVMSKDSDFVELQSRYGHPPKIIWVTCGNTSNARLQAVLMHHLPEAIRILESGEPLVEITG